ncbi:hypothetical protein JG688_00001325 [Phytophthora aleatoria]|uniref:Uncharacterized protein n=1 Tax=Phytophthora aleatoria TaxID=2496075 RepID=A0A8J5M9K6_9STRA|nr:hypothetical protein JG688_00001325 [Phytophthora aleatoria]
METEDTHLQEEDEMEEEVPVNAKTAPADALSPEADALVRPRKFKAWPKDFDVNAYRALKRGKERKAYLMSFGTKHGLQLPQSTTTSTVHHPRLSTNAKKPGRKKRKEQKNLVPQNLAWPKGMNQKEFLAKKPGKERMTYLASRSYELILAADAPAPRHRNASMPPDDLVEFLVYMASIKSANIGELIGTFEDSAAVAASIVIEEYMAQLIEDATIQQRALCPPTEASVQAFTRELLVGFNWQLFEQQHPFSPSDPKDRFLSLTEKEATIKDTLAALILREFVSTQPKSFDVYTDGGDVSRWIRSAVVIPTFVLTGDTGSQSSTGMACITEDHSSGTSTRQHEKDQNDTTPQIRLSVKTNPVHGNPEYKLLFAATLEDRHHIEASVGGLDSKIKAKMTISRLSKAVERQERRSKGTLEGPPKAPGPPPTPRPLPPQDPNDPYASMFEHLWEHFNAYTLKKWEMSMDKYLSATMPGWRPPEEQVAAMKRESTASPQRKQKKQKVVSQ